MFVFSSGGLGYLGQILFGFCFVLFFLFVGEDGDMKGLLLLLMLCG